MASTIKPPTHIHAAQFQQSSHYKLFESLASDSESESNSDDLPLLTPTIDFESEADTDDESNSTPQPSITPTATIQPKRNTNTYPIFSTRVPAPMQLPEADCFHGDTLPLPKPENRTRFLTKNIHHISTNQTDDEIRMLFGDQHRLEIDYFGISEHKLDTKQYMMRQAFITSACHTFQQHKIELGSSELRTVSTYKPGRTALIAQGDATGRIIFQDSDKYGRWSYFHLQG
jgi:hypothetical protein